MSASVTRTAFSKPELLSEILELDEDLIKRTRTILITLSCQLPINTEFLTEFCQQIARHYIRLYEWFPFPPTIHKALVHSRVTMLTNDFPIRVLAEDAAVSCNKYYRHNRQFHASKNSRQNNLMELINRALDSSDPS